MIAQRPRDWAVGISVGPVDPLVRQQHVDGWAPEITMRQVLVIEVARARLVELQDNLVVLIDEDCLFDGIAAGVAVNGDDLESKSLFRA